MINKFAPKLLAPQPSEGSWAGTDHLDSWKAIASYLRREVRTVQLWEKREGLPVHRHFHRQLGSVYALRSELEQWKLQVSRGNHDLAAQVPESPRPAKNRPTILVSPLIDNVASAESRELCDMMVDQTIAALVQLNPQQLQLVIPKVSSQCGPDECADQVPARKTADYVLHWTLRKDQDAVQVDASLLTGETSAAAWSHTFECSPGEAGKLPSLVAEQITQCVWLKLLTSSPLQSAILRREKRGAREAYLRGRYFWNLRDEEGLRKAIHCFESSIQEDPQFALPYSGLADSLTLLSFYEIVSPSEAMPSARKAALKAIELDPNLAEAHASLADVLLHFDRDWQGADREYRASIECNPGYALGYHWYANLLAARGQHEAAHIAIMHALEIDPVSIITLVWAGVTSHLAHHFDEAIRHYQSALELDPHFVWAHMYMAQALEQQGNLKGAVREFNTTIQLSGGSNCVKAMKAHAHAAAGEKSSARELLNEIKRARSRKCMPSYDIAATHAALGESDQAVLWLNRACDERNMKLFTLAQDPRFDPLRHGSAFRQIVDHMGLQQFSPITNSAHQHLS
jgi:tetratricopeptide (TPR) repeat protein